MISIGGVNGAQGATGPQGDPGAQGTTGSPGARNVQIYYYYTTQSSSNPGAPSTSQVSYNFSTNTASSSNANWTTVFSAPNPTTTSNNNKYWAILVTFSESSYGGSQNTPVISGPFNWLNFDGLVTFTNLSQGRDASGAISTTLINGGAITANTLTVDKIQASNASTSTNGITFGIGQGSSVNGLSGAVCGKAASPSTASGATFSSDSSYGIIAGTASGDAAGGFYNCRTTSFNTFDTSAVICTDTSAFYGKRITSASGLNTDSPASDVTIATSSYAGAFQYWSGSSVSKSATLATASYSFYGVGDLTVIGSIFASGNVVGYSSSDINYKNNVKTLTGALSIVDRLRGVSFNWNSKFLNKLTLEQQDFIKVNGDIGVIAQEVETVVPEVVHKDHEGMLTVNYQKLVPVLIEAIKELKLRVQILEGKQNVKL